MILGGIECDDDINQWMSMLKVDKVYHISELPVATATYGERNVVNNNLKLFLKPKMILFDIIHDCLNIPYQNLLPFVSLTNIQ